MLRNRFYFIAIAVLLVMALSGFTQEKPAATGGSSSANPETHAAQSSASAAAPAINAIQPPIPFNIPNQTLTIIGTNFQDGLAVTFENPKGESIPIGKEQVLSVGSTSVLLTASLEMWGKWKVRIANPNGPPSTPYEFSVAAYPAINPESPAVKAYHHAFVLTAVALTAVFLAIVVSLIVYMAKGQWSLGDALSEESSVQPKEIRSHQDVIMMASSSRIIALLGLLGILTIVLGVGFSVIWNLFVYGTVPQLAQVRSFLYGAATLFAPYLANQLRSIFDKSPNTPAAAPAQSAVETTVVTGVSPSRLLTKPGSQPIWITGKGFGQGVQLTFTLPEGTPVQPTAVDSVESTLIAAHVDLGAAGNWKVTVTNQGAKPSAPYGFTVIGPPTITAVEPANIQTNANPQPVTFIGSGFLPGLSVRLRNPNAGEVEVAQGSVAITNRGLVVTAAINVAGNWRAIIVYHPDMPPVERPFPAEAPPGP